MKHLRKSNARKWWKIVNNMARKPGKRSSFNFKYDEIILDQTEVVNNLNMFYASVNNDVPTFDITKLPSFLPAAEPPPKLQPHEVCKKLLSIRVFKSSGPDNIPSRILRDLLMNMQNLLQKFLTCRLHLNQSLKFGSILLLSPFRRNSSLLVRKRQDIFHLHLSM